MINSVFGQTFAIAENTSVFGISSGVSVFAGNFTTVESSGCNIFGSLFDLVGDDLFDLGPYSDLFGSCVSASTDGSLMYYGDYSFSPVPTIRMTKSYSKTGGQINVNPTLTFDLVGTLIDLTGGLPAIFDKVDALRQALEYDGKYFYFAHNGDILLEGYPRAINLEFQETSDNWTDTAAYTLSFEFDNEPADQYISGSGEDTAYFPPFLQSIDESWNIEFDPASSAYLRGTSAGPDVNPALMRISHTVGAVGKSHYSKSAGALDKDAWKYAKDYVESNLGFDYSKAFPDMSVAQSSGIFSAYDHFRVNSIDEAGGGYNVTETWAILETGRGGIQRKAIEDFTVNIRQGNQEDYNSIDIQGTIQGLEDRSYDGGFAVNNSRFINASGYWADIKDGLFIYPRAVSLASGYGITLNPIPLTKNITKSPSQGSIGYAYQYDDRPVHCITGAKFEDINIVDEYPYDVFNSVVVMGRAQGPILQDLNTVTSFKRQITIDVIMSGRANCSYDFSYSPRNQIASEIICPLYSGLTDTYNTVVKAADSESWNPKTGRYNRSIGWVATDCDLVPNTTLC